MLILFEFSLPPPNKQNVRDDSRPAFIIARAIRFCNIRLESHRFCAKITDEEAVAENRNNVTNSKIHVKNLVAVCYEPTDIVSSITLNQIIPLLLHSFIFQSTTTFNCIS